MSSKMYNTELVIYVYIYLRRLYIYICLLNILQIFTDENWKFLLNNRFEEDHQISINKIVLVKGSSAYPSRCFFLVKLVSLALSEEQDKETRIRKKEGFDRKALTAYLYHSSTYSHDRPLYYSIFTARERRKKDPQYTCKVDNAVGST